ncbi:MAG: DNA topoisomerase I [Planctomycetaceae bacterium]
MGSFLQFLIRLPVFRPVVRFLIGFIAIPAFRFLLKRVVRLHDLDDELEKDLEQWFRGSVVLLASTRVMEHALFGWIPFEDLEGDYRWLLWGFRIMLAIGVIESMPDQNLFAIVHPGPPKIRYDRSRGFWSQLREHAWPYSRGLLCRHINRSSPVFAILAAIAPGWVGWTCYFVAIFQYLIIGLVTSHDKALDVLNEFDRQVALRRREIIDEFHLDDRKAQTERLRRSNDNADDSAGPAASEPAEARPRGGIVAKVDQGGYLTK